MLQLFIRLIPVNFFPKFFFRKINKKAATVSFTEEIFLILYQTLFVLYTRGGIMNADMRQ